MEMSLDMKKIIIINRDIMIITIRGMKIKSMNKKINLTIKITPLKMLIKINKN